MRVGPLFKIIVLAVVIGIQSMANTLYANDFKVGLVSKLLSVKCSKNLDMKRSECQDGISQLIELLDFEKEDDRLALVFYKKKLLSLLNKNIIGLYFEESLRHIRVASESSPFDLWNFTKDFICSHQLNIDVNTMLAILLQDNAKFYQVNWLESIVSQSDLLSKNTYYYQEWITELGKESEAFPYIDFYPPAVREFSSSFNMKPYYFFMPWLMGDHIKRVRLNKAFNAFPLYISFVYKLHHHYGDYYSVLFKSLPQTANLVDGELVNIQKGWEYRYHDLYMAYLGNKLAIEDTKPFIDFCEFRNLIATNPQKLFKEIFR